MSGGVAARRSCIDIVCHVVGFVCVGLVIGVFVSLQCRVCVCLCGVVGVLGLCVWGVSVYVCVWLWKKKYWFSKILVF